MSWHLWPTRRQWRSWSLPSKYSFVGVLLGLLGLLIAALQLYSDDSAKVYKPNSEPSTDVYAAAFEELKSNIRCLNSLRLQIENSLEWPICRTSHVKIDNVFQNYFYEIGMTNYGEDNVLLYQWGLVNSALKERGQAQTVQELVEINKSSELTLRDLYFLQCFNLWYLSSFRGEAIADPADRPHITPESLSGIPDEEWENWPSHFVVDYDGVPVTDFGTWLGLID